MSLLVTGSIGIDTVKTPFGVSENCIGGSAIYFSLAASIFSPVRFVGVVGADCPFDLAEIFAGREVDLTGLEVRNSSKTFRWTGSYFENMNDRETLALELNVLAENPPKVPAEYKDSRFVFLANTAPELQLELLSQVNPGAFVAADTMDCWIKDHLESLKQLLKKIDALIINDEEARALASENNLIKAAELILKMGPDFVIIKKGESGSIASGKDGQQFILPAYPAAEVKDPTGAGDSFAGALMGHLAKTGKVDFDTLKHAIAYGTVAASFTIADFSIDALALAVRGDIENRFEKLRELTGF